MYPTDRRSRRFLVLLLASACLAACGGGGGGGGSAAPVEAAAPPAQSAPPADPPADPPPTQVPPQTEITVLGLITPGLTSLFSDPELRVQHLFNTANDLLADNGVALTLTLTHLEVVDYPDGLDAVTALEDLTYARHGSFVSTPALRDATAADLVLLIRPYANDGYCGYAWVSGYQRRGQLNDVDADHGYGVVSANCGDMTLLHEVGHLLGLAHSHREDPDGGTYPWSVGHGIDQDFVTLMASPSAFNAPRLPRLSSPDLDCGGRPCGVDRSASDGADARATIEQTKSQVASYR